MRTKNDSRIRYNNSGISLVEMIVVVAIMSVLVGALSIGLGMATTRSATQCASNMEICLNRCRTQTMGKNNGFVAFYANSAGEVFMVQKLNYPADSYNIESSDVVAGDYTIKKIGKNLTSVNCGGLELLSSENEDTPVFYVFERSAGSFVGCKNADGSDRPSSDIIVKKANRSYKIEIQKLTGKVVLTKS